MINKWITKSFKEINKSFIFKHFVYERESVESKKVGKFDVIKCLNWVNIVAINKKNELVLVKQYRHGIDEITLEIPGGAVEPGEDFLTSAKRELQEETGHTSNDWKCLGEVHPNPAFIDNVCKTYLALDCEQTHELDLDFLEEVEVVCVDNLRIKDMVRSGEITHSLVIAAFYLASINS